MFILRDHVSSSEISNFETDRILVSARALGGCILSSKEYPARLDVLGTFLLFLLELIVMDLHIPSRYV